MIRDITKEDLDLWLELTGEFYTSEAVDHEIPLQNRQNTFNALINKTPFAKGAFIEYENEVVGYVLLAITFSQEAGGECVWIEELYIREPYRSKGLGKKVFEWVEQSFPNHYRLRLEVEDDNTRAIKLYEKLGFERLNYSQMIKDNLLSLKRK